MKKLMVLMIFSHFLNAAENLSSIAGKWEFLSEEKGIKTFKMNIPNEALVAFRGETILNAPIEVVAQVISEVEKEVEWMSDVVTSKTLYSDTLPQEPEKEADIYRYQKIEYNRTKGPLIIQDRDFIIHIDVELNRSMKQMSIFMKPLTEEDLHLRKALIPRLIENVVRGEIKQGAYFLKSTDGRKKTAIVVEALVDPSGFIPVWVVNLFQESWAYQTLSGLQTYIEKNKIEENILLKRFFNTKKPSKKMALVK